MSLAPRSLSFAGSDGRPVRCDLHEAARAAPLVLVLHGFKGFRNWGFFPYICERLAAAGLSALRLDYSHNGVDERDFDRLDLFAIDTWTRHQEDLRAVLDGMQVESVGLLGHSRGGTDAILCAARDARVRAVCTLAAPASTNPGLPDLEEVVRAKGFYPIQNMRTGQIMPVARTQADDGRRYDVAASARAMAGRPLCLIHAEGDASVPSDHARRLAQAHGQAELHVLEGSGHTFGCVHPFGGPTAELERVAALTCTFFRGALGASTTPDPCTT